MLVDSKEKILRIGGHKDQIGCETSVGAAVWT